jgi:outer membrane protein assembly factor BamC
VRARPGSRLALAGALVPLALAGCSVTDSLGDVTRIDYKSATKGPPLDIPPDLVSPKGDNRYAIPGRDAGTTLSQFNRERSGDRPASAQSNVLVQPPGVRIERQGDQRWLVVDRPPDKVWPVLRDFWGEAGFALRVESPETGIMETDWAEKRPRVPDSWVRNQLTRALGSVYSTAERDKFRTRLESDGKVTEVFLTHRGLSEEFSGPLRDTTVWVPRPSDPELEAEFLRRMMVRFGASPTQVAAAAPGAAGTVGAAGAAGAVGAAAAGSAPAAPERVRQETIDGRPVLLMQDGFDRSWRQVGLALDRGGFTVEDRDRSRGTFFVRYVDPDQEVRTPGVIDRVFGTGPKKDLSGRKFRISVDAADGGTRVGVLGEDGSPPATDADRRIASRIVALLHDQLR